jgi:hypothetical protein
VFRQAARQPPPRLTPALGQRKDPPSQFTVEGPISAVSLDQVGRPDPWTAHRRADTMAPPRNPALHPAVVVEVAVAAVDPEAAGEDQAARRTCW